MTESQKCELSDVAESAIEQLHVGRDQPEWLSAKVLLVGAAARKLLDNSDIAQVAEVVGVPPQQIEPIWTRCHKFNLWTENVLREWTATDLSAIDFHLDVGIAAGWIEVAEGEDLSRNKRRMRLTDEGREFVERTLGAAGLDAFEK